MAFDGIVLIGRLAAWAAVVALYPLALRAFARRPARGDQLALGWVLGVGAGIAMLLPGHIGAIGAGIAGIGLAGLLGSPIGAGLAATLGLLAFSAIEPAGTLAELTALLASAPLGRLLARLATRQSRSVGPFDVAVLGAILAFVTAVAHAGLVDAAMAGVSAIAVGVLFLDANRRRLSERTLRVGMTE